MRPRRGAIVRLAALSLSIMALPSVSAQPPPARPGETRWVVASDAATDLWFHSLAVLGVEGPGTLPFYDAGYTRAVAEEKARRGIAPSKLDREAPRLRRAIMSDSAFELLHFLPLYIDRTAPGELPRFLRNLASSSQPAVAPEEVATAVRSVLSTELQRAVLADLADAIDDEWLTFFQGYASGRAQSDVARRRTLQARWDEIFVPRLARMFRVIGDARGVLLISPALGAEGRVVTLGDAGMIIAVSDWSDAAVPDAPLLAAIRELCFPLLQRVWEIDRGTSGHAARGAGESSRAAVQCGAQLVDALMPSSASAYRALFLSARPGESATGFRSRFDRRFQTDAATLRALSREIAGPAQREEDQLP